MALRWDKIEILRALDHIQGETYLAFGIQH
jgi:hypothetical protein